VVAGRLDPSILGAIEGNFHPRALYKPIFQINFISVLALKKEGPFLILALLQGIAQHSRAVIPLPPGHLLFPTTLPSI